MNDRQVQDLIRGMFVNQMVFRIMDNAKAHRYRAYQQGQEVQRMPLIADVVCAAVILFWAVVLGGTLLLSILGLIMLVFQID